MNKAWDIIIIGGGVIGCSVARLLSRYQGKILLLEAGSDVASGASKANSAIVHGGYDAKPGTLKARLNVAGATAYPALCKELGVPYQNNGSLVLCFREEDRPKIQALYEQGLANGVPGLSIIEREEILRLEPNVNPEVVCALNVTNAGITSPYELCFALADHAAVNGVEFRMNRFVTHIEKAARGYIVHTREGESLTAPVVVNCAGVSSAMLHNGLGSKEYRIIPRKGEYYLLDHQDPVLFRHTLFQLPSDLGKGILVTPTVHGNLMIGPTAEDVTKPFNTATSGEGLESIRRIGKLTWPAMNLRTVITTFAGIRAHEEEGDFVIGAVAGAEGCYEALGIESPGLSAAPTIAEMLAGQIAKDRNLVPKARWKAAPKRPKPFREMSLSQRRAAVAKDPEYGVLVCRCEEVTEAEVRAAIRRPVGAKTIDGVKRRTRAGMGRCQGGFCSPRVLEILCEELGKTPPEITSRGGESRILSNPVCSEEN